MPTDAPRYALEALFGTQAAELINHIPHCKRLGMEVVHVGPREATVKLPHRDELIGDPVRKVVFGGVITTLLDHASGLELGKDVAGFVLAESHSSGFGFIGT